MPNLPLSNGYYIPGQYHFHVKVHCKFYLVDGCLEETGREILGIIKAALNVNHFLYKDSSNKFRCEINVRCQGKDLKKEVVVKESDHPTLKDNDIILLGNNQFLFDFQYVQKFRRDSPVFQLCEKDEMKIILSKKHKKKKHVQTNIITL